MYFPLFVGALCLFLFCYALLCVHTSFAIILKRKRKLAVVVPDHTHLLFVARYRNASSSILHLWRVFMFGTMIVYGV